jgi:hypothetical protein
MMRCTNVIRLSAGSANTFETLLGPATRRSTDELACGDEPSNIDRLVGRSYQQVYGPAMGLEISRAIQV